MGYNMDRGMNKIIIVTRKTRLSELIYKYNTFEQAKFYIEHMGADFSDYIREDETYRSAVCTVTESCERLARVQIVDRESVPNMIFGGNDIVVAVGQDGIVANTMKYLDGQPLIGINPDIRRWDGVLLPFEPGQISDIASKVIKGNFRERTVNMAEAVTTDGQHMLAVNDLFIGQKTHVSARYEICFQGHTENQSSSGIIVSTGLGSTGWYRSVMAQLAAMQGSTGGSRETMRWDEERLKFVVREPFPSKTTQADIVFGDIKAGDTFRLVSKMPENGVIFSDGVEQDAIDFVAGMEVVIQSAAKKGRLVC